MTILILSPYYAPYGGVGSARMISLSKYLAEQGWSVTVAAYCISNYPPEDLTAVEPENVEIVRANWPTGRKIWQSDFKDMVFALAKERKFDCCISSVGPYDSMFFLPKLKREFDLPYIIDYRDYWGILNRSIEPPIQTVKNIILDIINYPIEKRAMKKAAAVVNVTPRLHKIVNRRHRLPAEKCRLIYNGYDESAIQPPTNTASPEKKNEYIIAVTGKFMFYNGPAAQAVLRAAARATDSGRRVVIEHMGTEEPEIWELIKNCGLPQEVYRYLGRLNYADAFSRLCNADAALQVYLSENGLGTKVFDYIAANKPILYVGTTATELADFVGQFENCFICEADSDRIYQSICAMVDGQVTSLGCGDIREYSRAAQNEKYLDLIDEIVNRKG